MGEIPVLDSLLHRASYWLRENMSSGEEQSSTGTEVVLPSQDTCVPAKSHPNGSSNGKRKRKGSNKKAARTVFLPSPTIPSLQPKNGWGHSDDPADYDMNHLMKEMADGMFIKMFAHDEDFFVATRAAPAGAHVKELIGVFLKGQKMDADVVQYPKGLTPPLMVIGSRMGGIGEVKPAAIKKQQGLLQPLLAKKRKMLLSTYFTPGQKVWLSKTCKYPVGVYMTLFKRALLRMREMIDRFLYAHPDTSKGDARIEAMKLFAEQGKTASPEEVEEAAFRLFAKSSDKNPDPYRSGFWPDKNHVGEWVLVVSYKTFLHPTSGTPANATFMGMREAFEKAMPDYVQLPILEQEMEFTKYAIAEMQKWGSSFIPVNYKNRIGVPAVYADKDGVPGPLRHVIEPGTVIQTEISMRGVFAGKFYGSRFEGGSPPLVQLLGHFLVDKSLENEEYYCDDSVNDPENIFNIIEEPSVESGNEYGVGKHHLTLAEIEEKIRRKEITVDSLNKPEEASMNTADDSSSEDESSSSDSGSDDESESEVPLEKKRRKLMDGEEEI